MLKTLLFILALQAGMMLAKPNHLEDMLDKICKGVIEKGEEEGNSKLMEDDKLLYSFEECLEYLQEKIKSDEDFDIEDYIDDDDDEDDDEDDDDVFEMDDDDDEDFDEDFEEDEE